MQKLGNLLQNKSFNLQELVIQGGDFRGDSLRDALVNNTTLKKLHLRLNNGTPAWVCRNSGVEDVFLRYDSIGDPLAHKIGEVLRDNTTCKSLKFAFGGCNNTSLETLDLSANEFPDES